MTTPQILITIILLQQGCFALMWWGAAWLRMARRPAVHWALATTLFGAAMLLIIGRPMLDPWLGRWLPNALNIVGFVLVWRGTRVFARLPTADAEAALVILIGAGGAAAALMADQRSLFVLLASGAMAWSVLRCAADTVRGLRAEFGTLAATVCSLPMWGIGTLITLRSLIALFDDGGVSRPLDATSGLNLALLFGFIALGMMLTGGMCGMVVMRLVVRLQHLSVHDQLTGVLNRRGVEAAIAAEHEGLRRHGRRFALLLLDIDHFKQVNDDHGHAAGDAVLAGVARTLKQAARVVDRVGRMGGEEFCVLLPDTGRDGALQAARRLLEAVRTASYSAPSQPALGVTVSIGLVLADDRDEAIDALWRRVDAALYTAKDGGRDRFAEAGSGAATPA